MPRLSKSERAEQLRRKAQELEAQERFDARMKTAATIPTCPECGSRDFKVYTYTTVAQSINFEDDEQDGDWGDDYESGDHTDVNESAECGECGADVAPMLQQHGWTFYAAPQPRPAPCEQTEISVLSEQP